MNAIVTVYRGLLESVELYADEDKARERYEEILKEKDLTEGDLGESDYDIQLETDLKIQDISQTIHLLNEALRRVQEFSYKDWEVSKVKRLIVNLQKVLK